MSTTVHCPKCNGTNVQVQETRTAMRNDTEIVRRRRRCNTCGETWRTYEVQAQTFQYMEWCEKAINKIREMG